MPDFIFNLNLYNVQDQVAGDDADMDQGDDGKPKKARRRRHGETEVNEHDFPLLQSLPRLAFGPMAVASDIPQFVDLIAKYPMRACVARLRRGHFKKVMTDTRQKKHVRTESLYYMSYFDFDDSYTYIRPYILHTLTSTTLIHFTICIYIFYNLTSTPLLYHIYFFTLTSTTLVLIPYIFYTLTMTTILLIPYHTIYTLYFDFDDS